MSHSQPQSSPALLPWPCPKKQIAFSWATHMLKCTCMLKIVLDWDPVQLATGTDSLEGYLEPQLDGEKGSHCGLVARTRKGGLGHPGRSEGAEHRQL